MFTIDLIAFAHEFIGIKPFLILIKSHFSGKGALNHVEPHSLYQYRRRPHHHRRDGRYYAQGATAQPKQLHNPSNGITGVLCQGQGVYLQVLEGERSQVEALYARIALDKRHQNMVLRQHEDITRRRYGKWAMAHIDLAHLPPPDASQNQQPLFDPYTATPKAVMMKMDALIAAVKVMDAPVI